MEHLFRIRLGDKTPPMWLVWVGGSLAVANKWEKLHCGQKTNRNVHSVSRNGLRLEHLIRIRIGEDIPNVASLVSRNLTVAKEYTEFIIL